MLSQRTEATERLCSAMDRIGRFLKEDRSIFYTNEFRPCYNIPYFNDKELNDAVMDVIENSTQVMENCTDDQSFSAVLPCLYKHLLDCFDEVRKFVRYLLLGILDLNIEIPLPLRMKTRKGHRVQKIKTKARSKPRIDGETMVVEQPPLDDRA